LNNPVITNLSRGSQSLLRPGYHKETSPDFSQTCRLRKASISLIEIYLSSSVLTFFDELSILRLHEYCCASSSAKSL
jgi:hypothetical protein